MPKVPDWYYEVETSTDRIFFAATQREAKEGLRDGEVIVRMDKIEIHPRATV